MKTASEHIWSTSDGRWVPTGHPDAVRLAYPAGDEVPDHVLDAFSADTTGTGPAEPGASGASGGSLKSGTQPANKMLNPTGDKQTGGEQGPAAVPPRGGPGSGRDEWAAYAVAHQVEVTDDMSRDDIVAACELAEVPVAPGGAASKSAGKPVSE